MEILVLKVQNPGPSPLRVVYGRILNGPLHVGCHGLLTRAWKEDEARETYIFDCQDCQQLRILPFGLSVTEVFDLSQWWVPGEGTLRSPLDQETRRRRREQGDA